MTCKDCLHVEVCVWKYEQPNAEKCKGFKERSRYVVREKGEWKLTVYSFYRDTFDESCELAIYIVANCSECRGNHPYSYQVFSKTLYAPEDAEEDFRFNQKEEEEKAIAEFNQRGYEFAYFCPTCGADMRKGENDG